MPLDCHEKKGARDLFSCRIKMWNPGSPKVFFVLKMGGKLAHVDLVESVEGYQYQSGNMQQYIQQYDSNAILN